MRISKVKETLPTCDKITSAQKWYHYKIDTFLGNGAILIRAQLVSQLIRVQLVLLD